jgi:hypothetical protein
MGAAFATLWQLESPSQAIAFDRRANVGYTIRPSLSLIKLALILLTGRCRCEPGVVVELSPRISGADPKIHFIVRGPSGVQIEFAFDPRMPARIATGWSYLNQMLRYGSNSRN